MAVRTHRWVVGLDRSELGLLALDEALSTAVERGGEVHVLVAYQPLGDATNLYGAADDPGMQRELDRLSPVVSARLEQLGHEAPPVMVHGILGAPAEALVVLAAALDADAIFVGTHGRTGLQRALLGSVAEEVVRRAGCPVHVARPRHHDLDVRWPTHHTERTLHGTIVDSQAFAH